jgi:hypothetical protein
MEKRKVIWFSRHEPTADQLRECRQRGWAVVGLDEGMRLGGVAIQDEGDVYAVGKALCALAAEHGADGVIGVWAAPMQEVLYVTARDAIRRGGADGLECFASWNTSREREGGAPTFSHYKFCNVGWLSKSALRCWAR